MLTDMPSRDGDRRGPGDAERARASAILGENAALGALLVTIKEPPGRCPMWCMDDAVSASAVLATNCELACTESWDRVFLLRPLGDNIFNAQHSFLH